MPPGGDPADNKKEGRVENVGSPGCDDSDLCPDPGRLPGDREVQRKESL